MKSIPVNLGERTYQILIGTGILPSLGKLTVPLRIGKDAYILTNALIRKKLGTRIHKALTEAGIKVKFKLIPDTEKSKSAELALKIIRDIAHFDKKKELFIIALGGGVVGDLAGFVASLYRRGTPYIQIPTTLLAQVDSSIGGKTAVDLREGKNLVGAFYQPKLVVSDVDVLSTLQKAQLRSGLSEVIKYGIIADEPLFTYIERRYRDILSLDNLALEFIICRSSAIKARIVELDEKEKKNIRTMLNFGHTIGHAIETAGNYKGYTHGEAVALGMLAASGISERLGLTDTSVVQRIERLIKNVGLPIRIKGLSVNKIIEAHYRDKKFIGAQNKFVLIKNIGHAMVVRNVPLDVIKEAVKNRL